MAWQKSAWRLYQTATRVLLAVPGVKALVKQWRLGRRLDTVMRHLVMTRLPNPVVAQGLTLYWHRQAAGGLPELAAGVYESDTRALVERFLGAGMTMVDLGAHLGFFSLIAAQCVGLSARVYAFEPQPQVYALLLRNIEANGFQSIIRPVNKALSNAKSRVALFLGKRDSGEASLYHTPGASSSHRVVVETTTLDDFFAAEGWPPVHLIKMDIEGAEKAALEGMRELSARNPELRLIMEFAPGVQAAAGVTPEELFEALLRLGFHKFSALYRGVQPLVIPQDIPRLLRMAGDVYVNLLCEK